MTLIKYSPKREILFGSINVDTDDIKSDESAMGGILKLCPTRWTVRVVCFVRIMVNYAWLLELRDLCLEEDLEFDTRSMILGCETQMKNFNYFFGLCLSHEVFAHAENLSKILQSSCLSVTSSQHLFGLSRKTLESIRSEESFNGFYDTVLLKVEQYP